MKKYIIILVTITCSVFGLISCSNFLDLDQSEYHSTKYQFEYFSRIKEVCTGVYSYITDGFSDVSGTMIDAATDDAVYAWNTNSIKTYYDGSWSAINTIDDEWSYWYTAIRAANYFLPNCPTDIPESQYLDDYADRMAQLKLFPYEVRGLRAYYHFNLLKRYNNIVIADHSITINEVNKLKPVTFDEAVDWIVNQLDSIIPNLPTTYKNTTYGEVGRFTKGAAMALKARVLLYAASPLNNTTNDKTKWLKAAKAAKDVIDLGVYQLVDEEVTNNENAKGLIFGKRNSASNSFESSNFPIGFEKEKGNSGICPSQNLVDTYDMRDGTPFNWNNTTDVQTMYTNRDPRFEKTILHNGSTYKSYVIQSYVNGANGLPKEGATPTSYYLRKHMIENTNLESGATTAYPHIFPLFRYAEVYLNYAEALFEAENNAYFTGTEDGVSYTLSPAAAINAVRNRSNMPNLPTDLTTDVFRTRMRNERRVELAFEGHRFWDLRRWKIGSDTNKVYGMTITLNSGVYNYERTLVQTRNWDDKYYFYPISNEELFKNHNLIQNTGW
jgi:hypothetical protein